MKVLLSVLFVTLGCVALAHAMPVEEAAAGTNWAVLVAGSRTYMNYRHQSDVYHAYQILHKHGVADDHIIMMHYDDIAESSENPNKGSVINHVGGPNNYPGVLKDYTGEAATPANFLAVLTGESSQTSGGNGRVLGSKSTDKVFVYFADHGGPGIVCLPSGSGCDELTADKLNGALTTMQQKGMFGELVFYMEACESGSMFDGLLKDNLNIYVTTAANPSESSYACYYDSDLGTYLGDTYSVNWMEDTDKEDVNTETLLTQYGIVKKLTTQSHVMQYGQLAMDAEKVGRYVGSAGAVAARDDGRRDAPADQVSSRDVRLHTFRNRARDAATAAERAHWQSELAAEHTRRNRVVERFHTIAVEAAGYERADRMIGARQSVQNWTCYDNVRAHFKAACHGFDEFTLGQLHTLVNLCEEATVGEAAVHAAIQFVCPHADAQ